MDLSRLGSVLVTRWGAATDVGPARPENEDSWLAAPPLFAVADGMGGHAGGAAASAGAVRALGARLSADALGSRRPDISDLDAAIEEAALAVAALADPTDPQAAPGSTLTGVLALDGEDGPAWLSFNIGDSRTYVVGAGGIRRLTKDHSALQEARDLAAATGEEVVRPPANIVTRALGAGIAGLPEPDFALVALSEGDLALICSDGVHGVLDDAELLRLAGIGGEPQEIANRLVDAALAAGTQDNATAVVVRAETASGAGAPAPASEREVRAVRPAPTLTARRANEEA